MIHSIENGFIKIEVNEKGAELFSFLNKTRQKEFLWNGNEKFWQRRSPILFPIVGRLKDDRYEIEGNSYNLNQHGFARDMVFKLEEKNRKSLSFSLIENQETLKIYPFRFCLRVNYQIEEIILFVKAEVINKDENPLPFSIGFHPAFFCPFEKDEKLEDYCLIFEKDEKCERLFLDNGLIAGKGFFASKKRKLDLTEELFANDAIILKNPLSKKVILQREDNKGSKIEVNFKGFPYLGLWKKRGAPFICIEPWQGVNDYTDFSGDFYNKEGIVILNSNESAEFEFSITLI